MTRVQVMRAGVTVLACCWSVVSAGAQQSRSLRIETALAQPSFPPYTPISLSPDGRWVAYTLSYPNRVKANPLDSRFTRTGVPNSAAGARVRLT